MHKTAQAPAAPLRSTSHAPGRHAWVEAAPFRAHLAWVAEVSGVPWTIIAVHAGVPVSLAARLLLRRHGRRLQRIPADSARRLLAVTPDSARALLRARVASAPTSARLRELQRRGWTVAVLAEEVGRSQDELLEILDGDVTSVAVVVALAVRVLLATSDSEAAGRTLCAA